MEQPIAFQPAQTAALLDDLDRASPADRPSVIQEHVVRAVHRQCNSTFANVGGTIDVILTLFQRLQEHLAPAALVALGDAISDARSQLSPAELERLEPWLGGQIAGRRLRFGKPQVLEAAEALRPHCVSRLVLLLLAPLAESEAGSEEHLDAMCALLAPAAPHCLSDLPHLLSPDRPERLSPADARVIAFLAASYAEHLPIGSLPHLLQLVQVVKCAVHKELAAAAPESRRPPPQDSWLLAAPAAINALSLMCDHQKVPKCDVAVGLEALAAVADHLANPNTAAMLARTNMSHVMGAAYSLVGHATHEARRRLVDATAASLATAAQALSGLSLQGPAPGSGPGGSPGAAPGSGGSSSVGGGGGKRDKDAFSGGEAAASAAHDKPSDGDASRLAELAARFASVGPPPNAVYGRCLSNLSCLAGCVRNAAADAFERRRPRVGAEVWAAFDGAAALLLLGCASWLGSEAQQLPEDAEEGLVNACKNLGMAVAASAEAVADPVAALQRLRPLLALQVAALAALLAWRKDVLVRALQDILQEPTSWLTFMQVFRRAADALQPVAQGVIEAADCGDSDFETDDDEAGCEAKERYPSDTAAVAAFRCARAILDLGDREAWAMQADTGGNGDGSVDSILTMYREAGELFGGLEISYFDRAPRLGLDLRSQALPLVAGRLLGALGRLSQTRPPSATLRHIQEACTNALAPILHLSPAARRVVTAPLERKQQPPPRQGPAGAAASDIPFEPDAPTADWATVAAAFRRGMSGRMPGQRKRQLEAALQRVEEALQRPVNGPPAVVPPTSAEEALQALLAEVEGRPAAATSSPSDAAAAPSKAARKRAKKKAAAKAAAAAAGASATEAPLTPSAAVKPDAERDSIQLTCAEGAASGLVAENAAPAAAAVIGTPIAAEAAHVSAEDTAAATHSGLSDSTASAPAEVASPPRQKHQGLHSSQNTADEAGATAAAAADLAALRLASGGAGSAISAAAVDAAARGWRAPDWMVCPLTQAVMADPHICADGLTYEKEAIRAWLAAHDESPVTGQPVPHKDLIPNHTLRKLILEATKQY